MMAGRMPAELASLEPPAVLAHLSYPLRWRLLVALAHGDRGPGELAVLAGVPVATVARELSALGEAHLAARCGPLDAPHAATYGLDRARLDDQCTAALAAFYPVSDEDVLMPPGADPGGLARVLFLCMHNAASSQMAEGILRHLGGGRVAVFSAGSAPTATHPLAVATLAGWGIDIAEQDPRHLTLLRDVRFDYLVTVCDCAREYCPPFVGDGEHLHWPIPDPSLADGPEEARAAAFARVADELTVRAGVLLRRIDAENGEPR